MFSNLNKSILSGLTDQESGRGERVTDWRENRSHHLISFCLLLQFLTECQTNEQFLDHPNLQIAKTEQFTDSIVAKDSTDDTVGGAGTNWGTKHQV